MVGRRVASVAFVALVVGCSYDWSVGAGSTSEPPSGTSGSTPVPPQDAGTHDAGDGGLNDCGPNCECKDKQTCRFTCATGRCDLKCSGSSDCKLACPNGATCTLNCEDSAKCDLDCTAGRSSCKLTCEDTATCSADCRATSLCTKDCKRPCDVKCSAGGICL